MITGRAAGYWQRIAYQFSSTRFPMRHWQRAGLLGMLTAVGMFSLSAQAETAKEKPDWEQGWASEAVQERMRWESLSEYRRMRKEGGVEVQVRLYQVPESEVEGVLKKLAPIVEDSADASAEKRLSRVLPLSAQDVSTLDQTLSREFTLPAMQVPVRDQRRVNLDRDVKSLTVDAKERRECIETGFLLMAQLDDRIPEPSRRSVRGGMPPVSVLAILNLSVSFSELIGFSDTADGDRGHRAAPWKDRLMERLLEFDYPKEGAFPILQVRKLQAELEVNAEMPEYLLLRLSSDKNPQAASDTLRQQMRRVRAFEPLADYPANPLEYWVVLKIQQIPGEKPTSL